MRRKNLGKVICHSSRLLDHLDRRNLGISYDNDLNANHSLMSKSKKQG